MSAETFLGGKVVLCCGDSVHFLRDQPDNRYDSIVTDPPYALISISKRFANSPRSEAAMPTSPPHARMSRGFMGQKWDNGEAAHSVAFWIECLRVLKPGGHVLAFAGTRTYHRLACAVEDAGFEIRDMVQWLYGSGFPKSHNQGNGWGTALKPANEPIVLARKPLSEGTVAANVLRWGTGAINIDGCRVAGDGPSPTAERRASARKNNWDATAGGITAKETDAMGRIQRRGDPETFKKERPSEQIGRWPANVITDGSEEVVAGFPHSKSGTLTPDMDVKATTGWSGGSQADRVKNSFHANEGSAARFFYHAKANKADRAGSKHPTIKPVALIRYLIRLVTPPGGLVLDPFAGTGTTAEAAFREGMSCALVEREAEYQADIRRRMALLEPASDLFTAEPTPVLIPAHGMGTTLLRSDPPPRWPRASYAARGRRVFPGPVR